MFLVSFIAKEDNFTFILVLFYFIIWLAPFWLFVVFNTRSLALIRTHFCFVLFWFSVTISTYCMVRSRCFSRSATHAHMRNKLYWPRVYRFASFDRVVWTSCDRVRSVVQIFINKTLCNCNKRQRTYTGWLVGCSVAVVLYD